MRLIDSPAIGEEHQAKATDVTPGPTQLRLGEQEAATDLYKRRKAGFEKAKAEWQAKMKELPEGQRNIDDKVWFFGCRLASAEQDPSQRQALPEWLDEPS